MIIGHPCKTSMIEVHEQMRLDGLEKKGSKYQITRDYSR